MSQDTMDAEEDGRRDGIRIGTARERRRIKRAQGPLLLELEQEARDRNNEWLRSVAAQLVAVLCAPKGKRR